MIDNLFGLSADSTEASPAIPLPSLLRYIMARTQLPVTTLVIALIYLKRLKSLHPACRGSRSSSPRVLFAALILACKFTTDDPFDNKAWSTVSCGLFGIAEVTRMEREMLYFLDYKLNVSKTEWVQFVGELGRCMSRSLRDKQQRLLQSSGSYEMFGRSSPVPGPHSLFMAPIPSGPLYQVPQFVPPPKENCAPHVPVDDLSRSSSGQTLFEARFSSESMEYDGSMYPQLTFSHLSKSNPWTYPTP